jgi:phosphoribosylglycinamide formyltransferase 1
MIKLAAFASGAGSNVLNLINHFKGHSSVEIALVVSNNTQAGAIEKAKANDIPYLLLSTEETKNGKYILNALKEKGIDYIVLGGYLKMIPVELIQAYPNKIINVHPSLLPKYGGKGMYGSNVHKAVWENKETESGITIHFVNEEYDKGEIIAQKKVMLTSTDTVHVVEIKWFPAIVESVILSARTGTDGKKQIE